MSNRLSLAALLVFALSSCAPPAPADQAEATANPIGRSQAADGAPWERYATAAELESIAFPQSGLDLERACLTTDGAGPDSMVDAIRAGQCWTALDAFVSGVRFQRLRASEAGLPRPVGASCIPDDADLPTLQIQFLRYLEANPAARNQRAGIALALAMEAAYPCVGVRT